MTSRGRCGVSCFAILAVALGPLFAAAQEQAKPGSKAFVQFLDGSNVYADLGKAPVIVETAFGKLTVPTEHIREIRFGIRLTESEVREIETLIGDLGSPVGGQRLRAAGKLIALRQKAWPILRNAVRKSDPQTAKLIEVVMAQIRKRVPESLLDRPLEDVVRTDKFTIVGRIHAKLTAKADFAKELQIDPSNTVSVYLIGGRGEVKLALDAARFGSDASQWMATGFQVQPYEPVTIVATGEVDLWPQGAGEYKCGPDGIKDTSFPIYEIYGPEVSRAGALIGKVGEKGRPFFIGSGVRQVFRERGELYLQIVPGPWSARAVGGYQVTIRPTVPGE